MNKILAAAITIALVFSVNAFAGMPMDQGNMFAAGGLSFTKYGGDLYKQGDDSPTAFSIYPEFYYFFQRGLSIGGNLEWDQYSIGDYTSSGFAFGVGAKYYLVNSQLTEATGAIFPYIGARFMLVSSKIDNGEAEFKESGHDIDFAGGGVYMLNDCIGAFGELDFSLISRKPEGGDSVSGNQFGFLIGITYFIIR